MRKFLAVLFLALAVPVIASAGEIINKEALKMMGEKDTIFIDVRTPGEYAGERVENSINIDFYSPDFKNKVNALDKSKKYVIYCRTGVRSAAAEKIFNEMGIKHTYDVRGGITAWKKDGLPVVK